jgi:HD-GYP domain-containing protein (c-di-GMP phosphodiesterase class II)
VAVQLVDMAVLSKMPRDACKAVAACAMVHDMGKALLPAGLLKESKFDAQQRAELSTHVARLMGCLEHCPWLSASVVKSIVAEINERLDGTGYPAGLGAADLGELSRLAMVVDVIDAMRRDRADRPAWRVADIYQNLREHPERFDPRWLKRYWQAFGTWPIGSLVRFETGALGWVQRLDGAGEIAQVQLTEAVKPPDTTLGEVLDGKALQGLGKPVEELPVSL